MSKLRDPQVTVQTIHTLQEYLEVYEQSPGEVRYHNTAFERETMSEDTSNSVEERTPRPKTPNVKRKRADDLERMIERSNANNVTAFEDWALKNCEDDWKDLYVLSSRLQGQRTKSHGIAIEETGSHRLENCVLLEEVIFEPQTLKLWKKSLRGNIYLVTC